MLGNPVDMQGKPFRATDKPHMATATEAAEFLGCSRRQLMEDLRRGVIPAIKVGKAWRIGWPVLKAMATGRIHHNR